MKEIKTKKKYFLEYFYRPTLNTLFINSPIKHLISSYNSKYLINKDRK